MDWMGSFNWGKVNGRNNQNVIRMFKGIHIENNYKRSGGTKKKHEIWG